MIHAKRRINSRYKYFRVETFKNLLYNIHIKNKIIITQKKGKKKIMDMKFITIEDALEAGVTKDELRKAINDILDSFDDLEETHACSGNCGNCSHVKEDNNSDIEETDLDIAREDMLLAALDYLFALGFIDEDTELTDELFDELIDVMKAAEEEWVPKFDIAKVFVGLGDKNKHKSSDDIIADFVKKLH